MKIGDEIETAIWLTGLESSELRKRYESDVTEALDYFCHRHGFVHGQVKFMEKLPNDERVPPVPHHIEGPRIRLLVAECELIARKKSGSFVNELDKKDLSRLRVMTRRVHSKYYPNEKLSDLECDAIIDRIGPEAALETLRKHV